MEATTRSRRFSKQLASRSESYFRFHSQYD
jgi:hypothetical protein